MRRREIGRADPGIVSLWPDIFFLINEVWEEVKRFVPRNSALGGGVVHFQPVTPPHQWVR